MYNKIVIGIDQSYTKTGLSIAIDGTLVKVSSMPFRGCRLKHEKRKMLSNTILHILEMNAHKANEVVINCERVRTFSHGAGKPSKDGSESPQMFISTNYIKSVGALVATIVDAAYVYDVPVYSVDTRSWKARIVGSSKGSKKDGNKLSTVKFVEALGFNLTTTNKAGKPVYDDDAADSACIALYGFLPESQQSLKKEE